VYDWLRFHRDTASAPESKRVQPAESSSIPILLPDRFFDHFHFDMTRFFRQLACSNAFTPKSMKGMEQSNCEGT